MARTKEEERLRWHERYKDPVYREKYLERKRAYLKERYEKDPKFREQVNERRRRARERAKLKKERIENGE